MCVTTTLVDGVCYHVNDVELCESDIKRPRAGFWKKIKSRNKFKFTGYLGNDFLFRA